MIKIRCLIGSIEFYCHLFKEEALFFATLNVCYFKALDLKKLHYLALTELVYLDKRMSVFFTRSIFRVSFFSTRNCKT